MSLVCSILVSHNLHVVFTIIFESCSFLHFCWLVHLFKIGYVFLIHYTYCTDILLCVCTSLMNFETPTGVQDIFKTNIFGWWRHLHFCFLSSTIHRMGLDDWGIFSRPAKIDQTSPRIEHAIPLKWSEHFTTAVPDRFIKVFFC